MSTFSAYGMGPKGLLVGRPLNDYEREHRLNIKKPASDYVHYDLSLIKLNSTFMEYVDKWYSMRGFMAIAGSGFSFVLAYGLFFGVGFLLTEKEFDVVLAMIMGGFILALWLPIKFILSDAFAYTHYPIRFNRKNRQVYVFRRDGSVLKAGWDEFYWTIYNTKLGLGGGDLNVMGHLLKKDGVTIKESIGLSLVDAGEGGRQNLLQFFEFVRRYMEQGPGQLLEALKPVPLIMLPRLDKTRESWFFGWEHLTGSLKGMIFLQILLQPFFFPISLVRWIVMRTSKIPQWPQWVEDECKVNVDDPWIHEGK